MGTLRALGVTPGQMALVGSARTLTVGVVGVCGGVVLSFLLSPLTPVGEARLVEPARGFNFDPLVAVVGVVATLLLLLAIGLLADLHAIRAESSGRARAARPLRLVASLADAGAHPSVLIGVRRPRTRGRAQHRSRGVGDPRIDPGRYRPLRHLGFRGQSHPPDHHPGAVRPAIRRDAEHQRITGRSHADALGPGANPGRQRNNRWGGRRHQDQRSDRAGPGRGERTGVPAVDHGDRPCPRFRPRDRARCHDHAGTAYHHRLHGVGLRSEPHGGNRTSTFRVVGSMVFRPDFGGSGLGTGAVFTLGGFLGAQCPTGQSRPTCAQGPTTMAASTSSGSPEAPTAGPLSTMW